MMLGFKKVIRTCVTASMRPLNHSSRKTSQFFTTLADKERGEEAAYFAKQDADAKAALRISVEDILAKDDSDSTKQELVDFIGRLIFILIFSSSSPSFIFRKNSF